MVKQCLIGLEKGPSLISQNIYRSRILEAPTIALESCLTCLAAFLLPLENHTPFIFKA